MNGDEDMVQETVPLYTSGTTPAFGFRQFGKPRKYSVEIRAEYISNTGLECYRCTNLFLDLTIRLDCAVYVIPLVQL